MLGINCAGGDMPRIGLGLVGGLCLRGLVALALAAGVAAPAWVTQSAMAVDPAREETDPTGWFWYYNSPSSQLNDLVANSNQRPVTLKRSLVNPANYDFATVTNSGTYQSGFWYYYNITAAQVGTFLSSNNARLVSLDVYDAGADQRFNVVMVPNTGSNARTWWWYYGLTAAEIGTRLSNNNARLFDLHSYDLNGSTRYACVMVSNTGVEAAPWGWFYNATITDITTWASANNQRLLDLDVADAAGTRFNAVLVGNTGANADEWYYWHGVTASFVEDRLSQLGARAYDVRSYSTPAGQRFAVLALGNLNAESTRVRNIMDATDGDFGLYIKQVDGPVLASLQSSNTFEPASMVKVLHHFHALSRVQAGATTLNTLGNVFLGTSGSCPQDNTPTTESLRTSLRLMMENSDNNRTQAMRVRFGENNINATAQQLGMTSTLIQHRIGCGGGADGAIAEPNRLTLRDAGLLYEAVADGAFTPTLTDEFYSLMSDSEGNGFPTSLRDIIYAEAASAGMSIDNRTDFINLARTATKGGNYGLSNGGPAYYHQTRGGWARLPFKNNRNCSVFDREYVLGTYVNDASNDSVASNAAGTGFWELLRQPVRDAIDTWVRCVGRCPADLDDGTGTGTPDGGVGIEDLLYFLAQYNIGSVLADLDNGSGTGTPDGGVGIEDLLYYLQRYDAGC